MPNTSPVFKKEIAVLTHWWGDQFMVAYPRSSEKRRKTFESTLTAELEKRLQENPSTPVDVVVFVRPSWEGKARDLFVSECLRTALKAADLDSKHSKLKPNLLTRFAPGSVMVATAFNQAVQEIFPKSNV